MTVWEVGTRVLPHPFGPYALGLTYETYRVIRIGKHSFIGIDWMGYPHRVPWTRPGLYKTWMGAACARISTIKRFYESYRY